ncbi:NADPH-dependent FMN reductase [Rhizobium sp. SL86]|uniref:NADPH-dependent FMN reductase n=1 Tax=Rhizobium sp. SL86 TaxID=2995148 RepID=UPI002273F4C9|nr:NAD(P)H-dependent oxidoreductase [Rhizobium sp. SL86]MCY1667813.1 NAD(P)H-dependent oxidoreductase [Rhizobium sp. SL86]
MKIAVIVGNPKPASRTLEAAKLLAGKVGGTPDPVIDLAVFGATLLEFGNADIAAVIASVCEADVAIFASPTYKATYTGLLKLFLDMFPPDGLDGVVALPLMLGAGPNHALAPDLLLKPVLVELKAMCPFPGLYLIDKTFAEDPRLDAYAERASSYLPLRKREVSQ